MLSRDDAGGREHERIVTGGGKHSAKLPQFKAVTLLGNLKTAIGGAYHAFDFSKYAPASLPSADTDSTAASA